MQPRVMLLDTASLYFRAFFGMPSSLRTPTGEPVNAVRGLLDFIAKLVSDHQPTHLACCWDNDWRPQWRVELLPSYKTHRVAASPVADLPTGAGGKGADSGIAEEAPDELAAQVPWIEEVLGALGLPIIGVDGFEADDVIGSLADQLDCAVDVVTGDRDLFQLVDDSRDIRVIYTGRGMSNLQVVDDAWVTAKYGISPRQYADLAALRGDPSDGIPGVAGVGEKTATTLLSRFNDLAGIISAAGDDASQLTPSQRKKLLAGTEYLAIAPRIVQVRRDLDTGVRLDDLALPKTPRDEERFSRLREQLGLGTSASRVLDALAR